MGSCPLRWPFCRCDDCMAHDPDAKPGSCVCQDCREKRAALRDYLILRRRLRPTAEPTPKPAPNEG